MRHLPAQGNVPPPWPGDGVRCMVGRTPQAVTERSGLPAEVPAELTQTRQESSRRTHGRGRTQRPARERGVRRRSSEAK